MEQQKETLWRRLKDDAFAVFMSLPLVFNQYVLFAIHATIIILISFTAMNYRLNWDFNGIFNYYKLFHDPRVPLVMINTVLFVIGSLVLKVGWGFYLALTTTYYIKNERIGRFFRTAWMLPKVTPGVAEAFLWYLIFSPSDYGLANMIAQTLFGAEPIAWLTEYPLLINILLAGIMGSTFTMVILSSSIQSIDKSYFYVAEVDGASQWTIFKDLLVPFVKWPLTFLVIWQGLSILTSFESVLLLTNGGPSYKSETWALYAYHQAFASMDIGYGSAIMLALLPLIIFIMYVTYKAVGFKKLMNNVK